MRKNLRLCNYDYSQSGAYFITICTKGRASLFCEIVGGDAHIAPSIKLSPYGIIADKYINKITGICKYVIMPNHIHMIIMIEDVQMRASPNTRPQPISTIVRSFKTLVTKECRMQVWQRNYYEHIIRNEEDYFEIWQYIDDNIAKWMEDEYYKKSTF